MSLYGKEKIWFLVNRLQDEREITSAGQPVALHPMNDLNGYYEKMDFIQLAQKLEKEHNAIKLLNQVPTDQTYGKYLIELLPDFDKYVQELRKDPKYLDWMGEKPEPEPITKVESVSVSHAHKNGIMTGKEKIQAVVEEINNKYQGLVTGNIVTVYSGNLEAKDIKLAEQKQILDILANDKKVIKYTSKNTFESQADIPSQDQADIYDVASDIGRTTQEMFDELLEQQDYKIEVLPEFEDLANELIGNAELEYQQDIYLLKLLYNHAIAILDADTRHGVIVEDEGLDFAYVHLMAFIDDLLNKPTMKQWQDDAPEMYETLLGNLEEIGEGWQYDRAVIMKYYAKLQKAWILQGRPDFEIDKTLTEIFDDIGTLIEQHKQRNKIASENFYKKAKTAASVFGNKPNTPTTDQHQEPSSNKVSDTPTPQKIDVHPLQPKHYGEKKGILSLSATVDVGIAIRGKVKRKSNGKKYNQCYLLECLFKSVNSLKNGVTFSTFLGVKYDKNNTKHIRKIRNTIDEINKKVADKGVTKKLIFIQAEKIYIDKSYL